MHQLLQMPRQVDAELTWEWRRQLMTYLSLCILSVLSKLL